MKIIDFGATRVAGIEEIDTPIEQVNMLGAEQYAAPEYYLGENGSPRSDIFSLGVIHQMLCGRFPYGAAVPRTRTRAAQKKLQYDSLLTDESEIPALGRRRHPQGGESRSVRALRRALRVRSRPAPPEPGLPQ